MKIGECFSRYTKSLVMPGREKRPGVGGGGGGRVEGAVKYAGNLVMLQENTHTSSIAPPINLMNRG